MPAPRLKLGGVEFEVPDMPARVLRERASEIKTFLEMDKPPLPAEGVAAICVLVQELARVRKIEMTIEEVEASITTRNLAECIGAVVYAYFAPSETSKAAPGEAVSPSN